MFRICFRMSLATKNIPLQSQATKYIMMENHKGFSKLTLNNPKQLNAINSEMLHEIYETLPGLNKTKAFWLEGAGEKAFSVGADVKQLYNARQNDKKLLEDFFRKEFTLDYKLTKMKSLQISNWDGYVMGSGVGLSIFSPYRIATENTTFAMVESQIGFFTDVCGAYFLSRLRNNIGYYLGLTGMSLKGQEVYRAGIANYYIMKADLPLVFRDLKSELARHIDPKQAIEDVLARYNKAPKQRILQHQEDIRYIFNSRSFDEIIDKLDQNKTPFYGKIRKAMEEKCPISAHVTFRNILMSRRMTARECFIHDFAVCQRFMNTPDFFEGIRCNLMEKGQKPKWSHKSIYQVPESDVESYFEPLPPSKELKL